MRDPYFRSMFGVHGSEKTTDKTTRVESTRTSGYHVTFGAVIPYIPSSKQRSSGHVLANRDEMASRYSQSLAALFNIFATTGQEDGVGGTYELRYIARPTSTPRRDASIELSFLAKEFSVVEETAFRKAQSTWDTVSQFCDYFDPTPYAIRPVDAATLDGFLKPIQEMRRATILSVRKFDELNERNPASPLGYCVYPFASVVRQAAHTGFFHALAAAKTMCMVSIRLSPTSLSDGELRWLESYKQRYQEHIDRAERETSRTERTRRMTVMTKSIDDLVAEREHLFHYDIVIAGDEGTAQTVSARLGAALSAETVSKNRGWQLRAPCWNEERTTCIDNLERLEMQAWGAATTDPHVNRLGRLVTPDEASSFFRLPVAPPGDVVPGFAVRTEPFTSPTSMTSGPIVLGRVTHRGLTTDELFRLSLADINEMLLLSGMSTSGKTNTALDIASQLWVQAKVPFLIVDPTKHDFRALLNDPGVRDDIAYFTVGVPAGVPFCMNPFDVAAGEPVHAHGARLLQCFKATARLSEPLDGFYAKAIDDVYQQAGWDYHHAEGGSSSLKAPTMRDFYYALKHRVEIRTEKYKSDSTPHIRNMTDVRIKALLESSWQVFNPSGPTPISAILDRPTVMELSGLGSDQDRALFLLFLNVAIDEELRRRAQGRAPRAGELTHVLFIDEAHNLMPKGLSESDWVSNPLVQTADTFSKTLREGRGWGRGMVVIDQEVAFLVPAAVAEPRGKILHRLEHAESAAIMHAALGLNEAEKERASRLEKGWVITRAPDGQAVLVFRDKYPYTRDGIDEAAIRALMEGRITMPAATPIDFGDDDELDKGRPVENMPRNEPDTSTSPEAVHSHSMACVNDPSTCPIHHRVIQANQLPVTDDLLVILKAAHVKAWDQVWQLCISRMTSIGITDDPFAPIQYLIALGNCRCTDGKLVRTRYPEIGVGITFFAANWKRLGPA